jgi:hypothetical protein
MLGNGRWLLIVSMVMLLWCVINIWRGYLLCRFSIHFTSSKKFYIFLNKSIIFWLIAKEWSDRSRPTWKWILGLTHNISNTFLFKDWVRRETRYCWLIFRKWWRHEFIICCLCSPLEVFFLFVQLTHDNWLLYFNGSWSWWLRLKWLCNWLILILRNLRLSNIRFDSNLLNLLHRFKLTLIDFRLFMISILEIDTEDHGGKFFKLIWFHRWFQKFLNNLSWYLLNLCWISLRGLNWACILIIMFL